MGQVASAAAHPHVFVKAESSLLFGPDGKIHAVRHAWTFDPMYSAVVAQDLGSGARPLTRADLDPVSQKNVGAIAPYGFYTVAKAAGLRAQFAAATDAWSEQNPDTSITMHLTLPLSPPASASTIFTLLVFDPLYSLAFTMEGASAIKLEGAPAGCSVRVVKPKPLDPGDAARLARSVVTNLSPGPDFGEKMADRAIVACP